MKHVIALWVKNVASAIRIDRHNLKHAFVRPANAIYETKEVPNGFLCAIFQNLPKSFLIIIRQPVEPLRSSLLNLRMTVNPFLDALSY